MAIPGRGSAWEPPSRAISLRCRGTLGLGDLERRCGRRALHRRCSRAPRAPARDRHRSSDRRLGLETTDHASVPNGRPPKRVSQAVATGARQLGLRTLIWAGAASTWGAIGHYVLGLSDLRLILMATTIVIVVGTSVLAPVPTPPRVDRTAEAEHRSAGPCGCHQTRGRFPRLAGVSVRLPARCGS